MKAREAREAEGQGSFGEAEQAKWRDKFAALGVDLPEDDSDWFQVQGLAPGRMRPVRACRTPRAQRLDASSGAMQLASRESSARPPVN